MVEEIESRGRIHYLESLEENRIFFTQEEDMVNIAVLGYGTVGSGVVEVINTNHESINKRAGQEINIKYVLDLRDFQEIRYGKFWYMIMRSLPTIRK